MIAYTSTYFACFLVAIILYTNAFNAPLCKSIRQVESYRCGRPPVVCLIRMIYYVDYNYLLGGGFDTGFDTAYSLS